MDITTNPYELRDNDNSQELINSNFNLHIETESRKRQLIINTNITSSIYYTILNEIHNRKAISL